MIKKWWQSLAVRERLLVSGGFIFVLILLFYNFVLNPLNTITNDLRDTLQNQQTLIAWMQKADARILQLRQAGFTATSATCSQEAILTLVERQLSDNKLNSYLKNVQQPQNNALTLQFQQIPFDDLMRWLQTISRHNNINATQFIATKTPVPGTVDVTLTITKKN